MPNARDTELLNCIRSYDQSPPKCQFDHWGLTVLLPPELAKQFEAPARHLAFCSFFEQMLPHCRTFISACPGTRAEKPEEVLQAFINHFVTPSKDNPIPNFQRYGHKGARSALCHLVPEMLLQFSEGTLPGFRQGQGRTIASEPRTGKPFRPGRPTFFISTEGRAFTF